MSKCKKTNKGMFDATVVSNEQIGRRFYRLGLEFDGAGAKAFAKTQPGQFAELDLSNAALPKLKEIPEELRDGCIRNILLRRPFSFCDVRTNGEKTIIDILYCVLGPATVRMTTLGKGDCVSVIGPLGNGFSIPDGKKIAILVAGGMGAPPLVHLAKVLRDKHHDIEVIAFVGAKSEEEFPLEMCGKKAELSFKEFVKNKVQCVTSTDDGSAGAKGFVTEALANWLDENNDECEKIIIYACGPEVMLERVAEIAKQWEIDCQVSMERRMACGFGLCQSCAVECQADNEQHVYKMCCQDGPVFDAKDVAFNPEGI